MKKKTYEIGKLVFLFAILTFLLLRLFGVFESSSSESYPSYSENPDLNIALDGEFLNVLMITVDTLRPDYLSFNGYDLETSPAIDSLLKRGIYFTHATTPIPRTTQALASLMSGCYPHKTGVRHLWDNLSTTTVTLSEVLKKLGYQTVAVVSNHVLLPERGLDRGFDLYDFGDDKRDAVKTSKVALKHFDRLDQNRPFFLWVHYIDPHVPYYPPKDIALQFDPGYEGRYKTHFGAKKGGVKEEAYPEDIGKERAVFHNDLGEVINGHVRRLYAADVKLTDIGIEKLLEGALSKASKNLLIVFTADHGESLGEHDYYYEHGAYVYNAGLRVPLAFILPRNHSNYAVGKFSEWVSLVDVFPTILDLLGIEVVSGHLKDIDGVSLSPIWQHRNMNTRPIFAESGYAFFPGSIKRRIRFDINGRFRCVFFKNMKLIWTPYQQDELLFELYNLENDLMETGNLYNPELQETQVLRGLISQWISKQPQKQRVRKPSKKDLEALRSLGYIK